jgi:hypothetical protein
MLLKYYIASRKLENGRMRRKHVYKHTPLLTLILGKNASWRFYHAIPRKQE